VDYHADPAQARDRVLQTMRLLDSGDVWREADNPFPGLEPFTAALRRVFFGRAVDARRVGNQLRAMTSTGRAGGMLVVVGPSGCGKSSLLNAAVASLLDSDPVWLRVPTVVPGTDPLPELARALAATAVRLGLNWSASEVRSRLDPSSEGLRHIADDLVAAGLGTHQRRQLLVSDR
jgi:Novel STAND NTPase 1